MKAFQIDMEQRLAITLKGDDLCLVVETLRSQGSNRGIKLSHQLEKSVGGERGIKGGKLFLTRRREDVFQVWITQEQLQEVIKSLRICSWMRWNETQKEHIKRLRQELRAYGPAFEEAAPAPCEVDLVEVSATQELLA